MNQTLRAVKHNHRILRAYVDTQDNATLQRATVLLAGEAALTLADKDSVAREIATVSGAVNAQAAAVSGLVGNVTTHSAMLALVTRCAVRIMNACRRAS